MAKAKKVLVALGITAVSIAAVAFLTRRFAPDSVRSLFQF